MSGKLKDPEDSHQSNDSQDGQGHILPCVGLMGGGHDLSYQSDKIGNNGDNVNHVHDVVEKFSFAWAGHKTYQELEEEPDNASCLNDEEGVGEGAGDGFGGGAWRRT